MTPKKKQRKHNSISIEDGLREFQPNETDTNKMVDGIQGYPVLEIRVIRNGQTEAYAFFRLPRLTQKRIVAILMGLGGAAGALIHAVLQAPRPV